MILPILYTEKSPKERGISKNRVRKVLALQSLKRHLAP